MKAFILFILILSTFSVFAQKRLSQTYDARAITALYINSDEVFEISVTTHKTKDIIIETVIDGELFASTLLHTVIDNGILKITTGKTPDYIPFIDKLSAHKVMAIELEIKVPSGLDLSIYSKLSSVSMQGEVGQLRIDLARGSFMGRKLRFRESAKINSITGFIDIDLVQGTVNAKSRNGKVDIAKNFSSGFPITIESLHGDITVRKSL